MSFRPEPHTPFDRAEWVTLARQRLRWASTARVDKLCGHQHCDLTQPRCCACIDDRPLRGNYLKYVDGRGMVLEGKRWSDYCPACKFRFVEEDAASAAVRADRGGRTRTESETRCVTCGELGHAMWDCPQTLLDDEEEEPSARAQTTYPGSQRSLTDYHRILFPDRYSPTHSSPHDHPPTDPPPPAWPSSYTARPPSPARPSNWPPRPENHHQRRAQIQAHRERSFGTLTEIANDPDYVSPITALYNNAYARFQERERERREHMETLRARTEDSTARTRMVAEYEEAQTNARQLLESLRRQVEQDNHRQLEGEFVGERDVYAERPSIFGRWYERPVEPERPARRREDTGPVAPPPEPLSKEELLVSDECKVCFAQHCDMLLMPCAHLALCEWCAHRTYPEINARRVHNQCVICRGKVTKMVKIYRC